MGGSTSGGLLWNLRRHSCAPIFISCFCCVSAASPRARRGAREKQDVEKPRIVVPSCASAVNRGAAQAMLLIFTATVFAYHGFDHVDTLLKTLVAKKSFPGAVALVANRTSLIYSASVGAHTYEPSAPPMRFQGTHFDVASLTKVTVTTTCAMLLYQWGDLHLESSRTPSSRAQPAVWTRPLSPCRDCETRRGRWCLEGRAPDVCTTRRGRPRWSSCVAS